MRLLIKMKLPKLDTAILLRLFTPRGYCRESSELLSLFQMHQSQRTSDDASSLVDSVRRSREAGWLEVLFVYFDRDLTHGHFFRTAVDNWAMYNRGGAFLNRFGNPHFFNRPSSKDRRLPLMDFQSGAARVLMEGPLVKGQLIVDHAVPISQLHAIIRQSRPANRFDIERELLRLYRLGVITRAEDGRLAKSEMPRGWSPASGSPFARYEAAGIIAPNVDG
jgi:hypothetical protein